MEEGIQVNSDDTIINRCISGDSEAFSEIVNRYKAYVFAIIMTFVASPSDAEDIAQEVMIQVYRSLSAYRPDNFKAWIGKIAVNKAIDWKRQHGRIAGREFMPEDERAFDVPGERGDPESLLLSQEKHKNVRQVVDRLPPKYRQVLVDYYFGSMSYQDIASKEGIAVRAVETRLYRAKHLFREKWGETGYETHQ